MGILFFLLTHVQIKLLRSYTRYLKQLLYNQSYELKRNLHPYFGTEKLCCPTFYSPQKSCSLHTRGHAYILKIHFKILVSTELLKSDRSSWLIFIWTAKSISWITYKYLKLGYQVYKINLMF